MYQYAGLVIIYGNSINIFNFETKRRVLIKKIIKIGGVSFSPIFATVFFIG